MNAPEKKHTAAVGRTNRVLVRRRRLSDILAIDDYADFHRYLIEESLLRYSALRQSDGGELGSVFAIGAGTNEADAFVRFPFTQIVLSGIHEPSDDLAAVMTSDARLTYRIENGEAVGLPSYSYDLVFCKEALHHLSRPVAGFYEMLRLCRRAAILIDPYDSLLGRLMRRWGLASAYERATNDNLGNRDNFVFRWSKNQLESLLNSYYVESGYVLDLRVGWMTWRLTGNPSRLVRGASAIAGWTAGLIPGAEGNYLSALIVPGADTPSDLMSSSELPVEAEDSSPPACTER